MGMIEDTTKAVYEQHINAGGVVVVDFFATWCGPCKVIAPKFHELSKKYPNAVFLKVDIDTWSTEDVENIGVRAMPTFYVYVKGERVAEVVGTNVPKLEEAIKKYAQ